MLLFLTGFAIITGIVYTKLYPDTTIELIKNLSSTESINFENNKDLTEVIRPSNTNSAFVYDKLSSDFVTIGGVEYKNSIRFDDSIFETPYVTYSLDGKYTELTGIAAIADNQGDKDDVILIIELDGVENQSIKLVNDAAPTELKIDLKNVKQLKIISQKHAKVGLAKLKIK